MKINRINKKLIILSAIVVLLAAAVVAFAWATTIGYRMTVAAHGFNKVADGVFLNNGYKGDTSDALRTIEEAKERVEKYFGEIKSLPVIILCDDTAKLKKLGGDHDTQTLTIFNVFSYISLSPEYLNVDIVAHELTHAEVHWRAFKGKLWFQASLPSWFDEGVALQNDYRETYNTEAWVVATDNGNCVVTLSDIDTPAEFYAGSTEERRYRYIVSKHEISTWVEQNGTNALLNLLGRLNKGGDFDSLYQENRGLGGTR